MFICLENLQKKDKGKKIFFYSHHHIIRFKSCEQFITYAPVYAKVEKKEMGWGEKVSPWFQIKTKLNEHSSKQWFTQVIQHTGGHKVATVIQHESFFRTSSMWNCLFKSFLLKAFLCAKKCCVQNIFNATLFLPSFIALLQPTVQGILLYVGKSHN